MLKRIASVLIVLVLIILTLSTTYANDEITIFVNGNRLQTDTAPFIVNDRTMLPLRAIFEALDAYVEWDNVMRRAIALRGDVAIIVTIGDNTLYRNGELIPLDVPAMIVNDRTMVPVRAIAESLGAKVEWDSTTRSVHIELVGVVDATDDDWFAPDINLEDFFLPLLDGDYLF